MSGCCRAGRNEAVQKASRCILESMKKLAELFGVVFGGIFVKSKHFTQVSVLTDFRMCFSSVFLVIMRYLFRVTALG